MRREERESKSNAGMGWNSYMKLRQRETQITTAMYCKTGGDEGHELFRSMGHQTGTGLQSTGALQAKMQTDSD